VIDGFTHFNENDVLYSFLGGCIAEGPQNIVCSIMFEAGFRSHETRTKLNLRSETSSKEVSASWQSFVVANKGEAFVSANTNVEAGMNKKDLEACSACLQREMIALPLQGL
jgi:hypothetical protein